MTFGVSVTTSRAIFDDALAAYNDSEHPCHRFRKLQERVPDDQWQLPEPFNGRSASGGIVFLGLNPSYDPAEDVPRVGSDFAAWDDYYRSRFETEPAAWHKLYRRYQRIGELAYGPNFRLGVDAMTPPATGARLVRRVTERGPTTRRTS